MSILGFNLYPKQSAVILSPSNFMLYGGSGGSGKAIQINELVLTSEGFKAMKDIRIRDKVYDKDGNICNVIAKSEIDYDEQAYELTFETGESVIVGASHDWLALSSSERKANFQRSPEFKAKRRANRPSRGTGSRPDLAERNARIAAEKALLDMNLKPDFGFLRNTQYLYENRFLVKKGEVTTTPDFAIGVCKKVNFNLSDTVTINPYVAGLWLGDGTSASNIIATGDRDIRDYLLNEYPDSDVKELQKEKFSGEMGQVHWLIYVDDLKSQLTKYNLLNNKHIPEEFFTQSIEFRTALLAGIMDSDGYVEKNKAFITFSRLELLKQTKRLACSLGIKCSKISFKPSFYTTKEGTRVYTKDSYTFYMYTKACPFRLQRKVDVFNKVSKDLKLTETYRIIKDIKPVPNPGMQCIQVDSPSHTYLITESYIPTHNSYLIRASSIMFSLEIPNLTTYIFRRTFPEVMSNHWFGQTGFVTMLKPWERQGLVKLNKSDRSIEWQNGSRIVLAYAQYEKDIENYTGVEIQNLIIDESTKFTPYMIEYLLGRLRLGGLDIPEKWKHKFPFCLLCSNPLGPSHTWHKKIFVDFGDTIHRLPDDKFGMLAQFIQASPTDNTILLQNDPGYIKRLGSYSDKRLVASMRDGIWEDEGATAFPSWDKDVHEINPFIIPYSWTIKRGYDYGHSAPFSVLYYAVANGDDYKDREGNSVSVPKGSIFIIDEIYGADKDGNGLRLEIPEVAEMIKPKDELWNSRGFKVLPGPADNAIYSTDRGDSIGKQLEKEGIKFVRSNKNPGSRVIGLRLINERLYEALRNPPEKPYLKVFSNCVNLIKNLKDLQLDEKNQDDIDTTGKDHDYDVLRYIVLGAKTEVSTINVVGH